MTPPDVAFNFDEPEGEVNDYSGNERHFSLGSNAARTLAVNGNGLTKVGTGTVTASASPTWISTGSWSFMFWQQGMGDSVWWVRIYNNGIDSGSGALLLSGTLRIRIRRSGGSTEASITPPSDGLPHHYCFTYDGVNGRVYLDGNLVATTAIALAPTVGVDRLDLAEHTQPTFWMDDFRFFPIAIDSAEINSLKDIPVSASVVADDRWSRGDGVVLRPHVLTGSGLVELE